MNISWLAAFVPPAVVILVHGRENSSKPLFSRALIMVVHTKRWKAISKRVYHAQSRWFKKFFSFNSYVIVALFSTSEQKKPPFCLSAIIYEYIICQAMLIFLPVISTCKISWKGMHPSYRCFFALVLF